jgi:hypothetical protein
MTYDEQIAELTAHPENIRLFWGQAEGLFKMLEPPKTNIIQSGCLTMIKDSRFIDSYAFNLDGTVNKELTEKIRNDERIPGDATEITIDVLPIFKQYQEEYDEMLEKQAKELTN